MSGAARAFLWTLPGLTLFALGVMRGATWAMVAGALLATAAALHHLRASRRRRRALATPLSDGERAILERSVWYYRDLDEAGRARFERLLQGLKADYAFEAVGGATLDDEVRVLSLAGAAVLAMGGREGLFPGRRTVLIYPDHFDDDYDTGPDGDVAGMVHHQGPIIFSRRALRDGWARRGDGYNVAIHEFAHVLDLGDGFADGVPALADDEEWAPLIAEELARVHARRSALRSYAGTNAAELFAVAVESYFERPKQLEHRHPELHERLRQYFEPRPPPRSEAPEG